MRKYFKGINSKEADGWLLADCGNSNLDDLQDWIIDTHSLQADQVPEYCNDAKLFSKLVSGLLNCYYGNIETKGLSEEFLCETGTVTEEQRIPSPLNSELPFNSQLPF